MEFIVYEPLSERKPDFPSNLVTAFKAAESYEYCHNWQDIGEFSLTVPIDTEGIESVREDMLLIVQDDYNTDSLVITSIINNGKNITLKGFDLKVMMKWRVTVFPDIEFDKGTYGYDVAQGNTGEIIEHYIERNFINPRDSNRKIYGLRADNLGGGIRTDTYMSRMEPVNEVIEKLCKNADIGYDIDARNDGYEVSIRPGTDRTNSKTVFEKVVFADFTMDADGITVETSVNDRGNIIWAVNGGDADTATVISVDNSQTDSEGNAIDSEETEGFMRREIVTTTNCDIDEIQIYAQKSAEDKFNKTTITFELKDFTMFINRFYIGDVITVLKGGKEYNKRVLSANKRYNGSAKTISITLGNIPERKPFKKLYYNSYENKQGIIAEKLKDIEEAKKPEPSGLTIENAVILSEDQAAYILHKYSEISYVSGQRAIWSTIGSSVVCQGLVVSDWYALSYQANKPTLDEAFPNGQPSYHTKATITTVASATDEAVTNIVELYLDSYSMDRYYYRVRYSRDGGNTWLYSGGSYVSWYVPSPGFFLSFSSISPAGDNSRPNGYLTVNIDVMVQENNASGAPYRWQKVSANVLASNSMIFANEVERNAAIALRYEPQMLTQVIDTQTITG